MLILIILINNQLETLHRKLVHKANKKLKKFLPTIRESWWLIIVFAYIFLVFFFCVFIIFFPILTFTPNLFNLFEAFSYYRQSFLQNNKNNTEIIFFIEFFLFVFFGEFYYHSIDDFASNDFRRMAGLLQNNNYYVKFKMCFFSAINIFLWVFI